LTETTIKEAKTMTESEQKARVLELHTAMWEFLKRNEKLKGRHATADRLELALIQLETRTPDQEATLAEVREWRKRNAFSAR